MSESPVLGRDALAPVTSAMGFLRASLDTVAEGLLAWRQAIHGRAWADPLAGGLRDHVQALEPLTGGVRPRELVVATENPEWTAVFDCGVHGGDPTTTVGYLSRTLRVQGIAIVSIPDSPGSSESPARFGARQFEMFAPISTDFLNYVRSVSVVRDGDRWRFDANGTVQDFENIDAYKRNRIHERFTGTMLTEYAAALGLKPFEEGFFPGPSVLVRNPAVPPPGALALSLPDVQKRIGLRHG